MLRKIIDRLKLTDDSSIHVKVEYGNIRNTLLVKIRRKNTGKTADFDKTFGSAEFRYKFSENHAARNLVKLIVRPVCLPVRLIGNIIGIVLHKSLNSG